MQCDPNCTQYQLLAILKDEDCCFSEFVTPLLGSLPNQANDEDGLKEMVTQLNSCLAEDDWIGVNLSIDNIFYSEDSKNETLMENLISKIVIPQKHWKSLERGHSMHSLLLLRVISIFVFHGNKESIEKCVYQCEGLVSLQKCFVSKGLPDSEQMICLLTLAKFLQEMEYFPKMPNSLYLWQKHSKI